MERIEGLVNTRRPETGVGLIQLLKAVNWMKISLGKFAEVVGPLLKLLGELLTGTNRTKSVAKI